MFNITEHENNINQLSELLKVEGVDTAKASLIIQALRDNYSEVNTSLTDNTKKIGEINELNEGLRSANMNLLAKLGKQMDNLGQASNNNSNKYAENEGEEILSLDALSQEFLK